MPRQEVQNGAKFAFVSSHLGRIVEGGTPDSQRLTVRALIPHALERLGWIWIRGFGNCVMTRNRPEEIIEGVEVTVLRR